MTRSQYLHALIIFPLLFAAACSTEPKDKNIVATVNDTAIPVRELRREMARHAKQYPSAAITSRDIEDQLNTMIENKLMLQEAIRLGLSQDERFVETIKTYWEQTLVRDLIDARNREWEKTLFVTDSEIQSEYRRMQYRPVIQAARAGTKEDAEHISHALRRKETVPGMETIAPGFDDVKLSPLAIAFDMEPGEARVLGYDNAYLVIRVVKKDRAPLPPLTAVRDRIKASLLDQKRHQALARWVEGLKQAAKITVNREMLNAKE